MKRVLVLACVMFGFALPTNAAEHAWYGFHIKAETAGFPLDPVVRSVVIDKVKANSPATAQDIRVGDEIIEADGQSVLGARALRLIGILSKHPGETLRLALRRPTGETYRVAIVGITKPTS